MSCAFCSAVRNKAWGKPHLVREFRLLAIRVLSLPATVPCKSGNNWLTTEVNLVSYEYCLLKTDTLFFSRSSQKNVLCAKFQAVQTECKQQLSSVEFKEYSFSADVSRYASRMHNMRRAYHLTHAQILLETLVSVGSLTSPASEPRHFVEAIYYT